MVNDAAMKTLSELITRRALFHLIALNGGQVTVTPEEFDAGLGMSVSVRVTEGKFLLTLVTPERLKELGPVVEV